MEIASTVVGPVVNLLTVHITQKLRNLTSFTKHVEHMKERMQFLEDQSDDMKKHVRENQVSNLEIPTRVPGWLEAVENIKEEADNISSNDIGCFDVKKKYRAGRDAFRVIKVIEGLIKENSDITWSNAEIPYGLASTSGGGTKNLFKSRDEIFKVALKFLQQDDDTTRVIALCGMGGVGKTTLMKQLKEAAHHNKMFDLIVEVVIGKLPTCFPFRRP